MPETAASLYLSLIKKTLTFTLWDEPGTPIETYNSMRPLPVRLLVSLGVNVLSKLQLQVVRKFSYADQDVIEGKIVPLYAQTMVGMKRLDNIQFCVESVIQNKVEGDLIETGVWRGGSCILMRAALAAYGVTDGRVIVADSFTGLPQPDPSKYPQDQGDTLYKRTYLAVPLETVRANFAKYDLLDDQVVFLQGWFEDTLPTAPVDKLAVMRLDGDMYGSTIVALNNLYPKLSSGGYCIIDDYSLPAARQAVEDYRVQHNIKSPIIAVDWTGAYWQKD